MANEPILDGEDLLAQMYPVQQPTRVGRTRPARRFDQTQLKVEAHGRQVNRDYAAHFFRWTTVKNQIGKGDRVLDIGCGQEVPLVRVLTHQIVHVPDLYVGVELSAIPNKTQIAWTRILDEFNFVERWREIVEDFSVTQYTDQEMKDHKCGCEACYAAAGPCPATQSSIILERKEKGFFTVITCFEAIEHMGLADGLELLKGARELLAPDGQFFLSTPVFSGKAAVNHVHEYTIAELQDFITTAGLEVVRREGTFADVNSLKKVLSPEEKWCWEQWEHRLGNDGLSVVFATLHPNEAKNNLWTLRRKG